MLTLSSVRRCLLSFLRQMRPAKEHFAARNDAAELGSEAQNASEDLDVSTLCGACGHREPVDLTCLIDRSKGNLPVQMMRFLCSRCSSQRVKLVVHRKAVGSRDLTVA